MAVGEWRPHGCYCEGRGRGTCTRTLLRARLLPAAMDNPEHCPQQPQHDPHGWDREDFAVATTPPLLSPHYQGRACTHQSPLQRGPQGQDRTHPSSCSLPCPTSASLSPSLRTPYKRWEASKGGEQQQAHFKEERMSAAAPCRSRACLAGRRPQRATQAAAALLRPHRTAAQRSTSTSRSSAPTTTCWLGLHGRGGRVVSCAVPVPSRLASKPQLSYVGVAYSGGGPCWHRERGCLRGDGVGAPAIGVGRAATRSCHGFRAGASRVRTIDARTMGIYACSGLALRGGVRHRGGPPQDYPTGVPLRTLSPPPAVVHRAGPSETKGAGWPCRSAVAGSRFGRARPGNAWGLPK